MTDKPFDLEQEAFSASVADEFRIRRCRERFDFLERRLLDHITLSNDPVIRARQTFDRLWLEKPERYTRKGHFELNKVISNQLSRTTRNVGNCLGLTLLFNCLLTRLHVDAKALYMEDAFDRGPHVLTLLTINDHLIEVENILPDGFDYKGHMNNPSKTIWGDEELAADIHNSIGNEYFDKGEFHEALKAYEKAATLNPEYEPARLNNVIILDKLKDGPISG